MKKTISQEIIEERIFVIRGQKVMIDRDLAELYGVETKYLNRQVRRNKTRFPEEFMFKLTREEKDELVTICHRLKTMKHSTSRPYVFTEYGVVMLANVLKSEWAVRISIAIVKTFVKLRQLAISHAELAKKLKALEKKYDAQFKVVFEAIRQLMAPPDKPKRKIGFSKE